MQPDRETQVFEPDWLTTVRGFASAASISPTYPERASRSRHSPCNKRPDQQQLVALWLDVSADQVQVVLDYSRIDPEPVELAAGACSEQARAEELSRGAARRLRQAARRLVHIDGLSLRDAAAVLGVTFGRVQQLLKD